jgi:hypothetical protein
LQYSFCEAAVEAVDVASTLLFVAKKKKTYGDADADGPQALDALLQQLLQPLLFFARGLSRGDVRLDQRNDLLDLPKLRSRSLDGKSNAPGARSARTGAENGRRKAPNTYVAVRPLSARTLLESLAEH